MKHLSRLLMLVCLITLLVTPANPRAGVQSAVPRLVVFEGFFSAVWPNCQTAGRAVDTLAEQYASAGKSVIFIEYNVGLVDGTRNYADVRFDRARAAHKLNNPDDPNAEYHLPPVMTDSTAVNARYHEGLYSDNTPEVYYKKDLIDPELTRAPQAEVTTVMWRVGNHMHFQVKVKNLSGKTLSNAANGAAVVATVYEDVTRYEGSTDTSRIARGGAQFTLSSALANNATATYDLDTADMSVINWNNLHGVAMIDYRPGGATGAYDMLQADMATLLAQAPYFSVNKTTAAIPVDLVDPGTPQTTVTISGYPADMTWSATKDSTDWFSITPASGQVGSALTIQVDPSHFTAVGTYEGSVHLSAASQTASYTQDITVRAVVTGPSFTVDKTEVYFMIDMANPGAPQSILTTGGYPSSMSWSAVKTGGDWFSLSPSTGQTGSQLTLQVDPSKFTGLGDYSGSITLTADGILGPISREVSVKAGVFSSIDYFFLPLIFR